MGPFCGHPEPIFGRFEGRLGGINQDFGASWSIPGCLGASLGSQELDFRAKLKHSILDSIRS